ENAVVAVLCLHRTVTGLVDPIFRVVRIGVRKALPVFGNEALVVAVDGLEHAGPRPLDDEIARVPAAGLDLVAVVVENVWFDPRRGAARTPGFHVLNRRQIRYHVAAVLGLPPRVDDDGAFVAD